MTGPLFWSLIIVAAWWYATRPARHTAQDRADIRRIRAAQRRVMR